AGSRALIAPSLNRPAVETYVKVGNDSKWLGALTWNFVRSLKTLALKSTVRQLDGAMGARTAGQFAQNIRARDFTVVTDTAPAAADPKVGVAAVGDGTPQASQVGQVVPEAGQKVEAAADKGNATIETQPSTEQKTATFDAAATGQPTPGAA